MIRRIQALEEIRIRAAEGHIEIHLAEQFDGTWNLTINQFNPNTLRIGIPVEHGTRYMYWNYIRESASRPTTSEEGK